MGPKPGEPDINFNKYGEDAGMLAAWLSSLLGDRPWPVGPAYRALQGGGAYDDSTYFNVVGVGPAARKKIRVFCCESSTCLNISLFLFVHCILPCTSPIFFFNDIVKPCVDLFV